MKMKSMVAALVALAFTAALALVFTSTSATGGRTATLTNVSGTVLVKSVGAADQVQATERMVVKQGDEIRTEARSSAILRMDDGSMLKIGPLAKMTIDQLGKSDRDNKTTMGIEVGKTWNRVNRLSGDSQFNVKTPTAVAGVRGTYFASEVEQTSDSTFDVFDGQVEVSSASDPSASVMAGAGQRTQVAPGKNPTAPSAIPADQLETGASGFSDAEAALATYDLQISVNPQVVVPGEAATVSVQVFRNGQPLRSEVNLKLTLSGSATFANSGTAEIELTTNNQGAATTQITSSERETVTVSAELRIRVPK